MRLASAGESGDAGPARSRQVFDTAAIRELVVPSLRCAYHTVRKLSAHQLDNSKQRILDQ
jgi:hypothetical protein